MKKKMLIVLLVLVFSLTLAMPAPALAQSPTFHVKPTPVGNADGSDWDNACSLQYALTNAASGDEIWVAEGTYKPTSGTDRSVSFQLDSGEKVYGGFEGIETSREQRDWENNETILSGEIGTDGTGDNSYHVIIGTDNVTLDGFTISGGNANGGNANGGDEYVLGGGMYNYNSSPTVTNCTFDGNSAGWGGGMFNDNNSSANVTNCTFEYNSAISAGGGMYNNNSSPTVDDCTFRDNSASQGGGMQNSNSSPTVTGCTFSGNSAGYGGGMQNYDNSSPTVTGCIFSGNSADYGGGMYNLASSSPMVTNCVFSGNSADGGGGMSNDDSSPTVINCIFSGNSASYVGGGMYNDHSSPTVTNCTFSDNSAVYYGGGGMYNNYSSPTVTNCILWDNSPDQIKNHNNSSPNVTYCDVQGGYTGDGNMGDMPDDDPMFADPDNSDFHLLSDSPCIDAGSNAAVPDWLTTDFEGQPRIFPIDGTVDMGADEFVIETVTATVDIDPDTLNLNTKGKWITCYIELEESYNVDDIDVSTIKLNDEVDAESKPTGYGDCDEDGIPDLMVKFDRAEVQKVLEVGDEVEIVITGKLTDGTSFEGKDTITVID